MKIRELLLDARIDMLDDSTQEKLSSEIGVTNKKISKWEVGECNPTVHELRLLSGYFGIPISELIEEEEINLGTKKNIKIEDIPIFEVSICLFLIINIFLFYCSLEAIVYVPNYIYILICSICILINTILFVFMSIRFTINDDFECIQNNKTIENEDELL